MDYKEIPGFPRYGISTDGEIKNFKSGRTFKGSPNGQGYYITKLTNSTGKLKTCRIHILVAMTYLKHIPCGHKIIVDHHDNKRRFDNSLNNLRLITHSENITKDIKNGTSKYHGVNWFPLRGKWISRITINGKKKYLGLFPTEEEAYQAYLKALNGID